MIIEEKLVLSCLAIVVSCLNSAQGLKSDGANVCPYQASDRYTVKERTTEYCFRFSITCSKYRQVTKYRMVTRNKCCSHYISAPNDPDNCALAVCMGRDGADAGTCPNGGTCAEPNSCSCLEGYSEPECQDTDECVEGNGGCSDSCVNTIGSFECRCPDSMGLVDDSTCAFQCFDASPGTCDNNGRCDAPDRCLCQTGFKSPRCADINECEEPDGGNGGCSQTCVNSLGSYQCECGVGYSIAADNHSCRDIDECNEFNGSCSQTCVNTEGSYLCECRAGFTLAADGKTCNDVDECEETDGCDHICDNTPGSYECSCNTKFRLMGDKKTCEAVCFGEVGVCPNRGTCVGPDQCTCLKGFKLPKCEDINECNEADGGNGGCSQSCVNTAGSYRCECDTGYSLQADMLTCGDIDECNKADGSNGGCSDTCVNIDGSYRCECESGYLLTADKITCKDIDECNTPTGSKGGCSETCVNTPGSHHCECQDQYALVSDKKTCMPVCGGNIESGDCLNGGRCTSPGVCECPHGYNGILCADTNECSLNNGGCSHECINDPGTHHCQCPNGYELQLDTSCVDIDECEQEKCGGVCVNTHGSFTCTCHSGYRQTGELSCQDIDECEDNTSMCEQGCENTPGSYRCSCEESSVIKSDGHSCFEVKLCASASDPGIDCAPHSSCFDGRCVCPFKKQLHTNGIHCIDPCIVSPCLNDGKCIANFQNGYRCNCMGKGYTGPHCETGIIGLPSSVYVHAGELHRNMHINANPKQEIILYPILSDDGIHVYPNPIIVQEPTKFDILVDKRGIYDIEFNITGANADVFQNVESIRVRADDVFSRLQLLGRVLPTGCFWLSVRFMDHTIWFSSTSRWYKLTVPVSPPVFSSGIIMMIFETMSLPISRDGVEIKVGSRLVLSPLSYHESEGKILENHKDIECEELYLSSRDMNEFRNARSIFWSLFSSLKKIVPYWLQMEPLESEAIKPIPFTPQFLTGRDVQKQSICTGAPTQDDVLYLVYKFKDPFKIRVLQQMFELREGDFCFIVDILSSSGVTVFYMFSEEAAAEFEHLDMFKILESQSTLKIYFTGFGVSLPGEISLPHNDDSLTLWNGAGMFRYPFAKKANIWCDITVKRHSLQTSKYFNFEFTAVFESYLANADPHTIFTHLFIDPRDVFFRLRNLELNVDVGMLGKTYNFRIDKILLERRGVLAIGGYGNRTYCGGLANPPGVFLKVRTRAKLFSGIPIIEDLILKAETEFYFFKTFPEGKDRVDYWESGVLDHTTVRLTELNTTAVDIVNLIESLSSQSEKTPWIREKLNVMLQHMKDISSVIDSIMSDTYKGLSFAEFTKNVTIHVTKVEEHLFDLEDRLSLSFDTSMDSGISLMEDAVKLLRDRSAEIIWQLYQGTMVIFPNSGTWGLKGKFGITILGTYFGIEGELVVSDENTIPCVTDFSEFYDHLEGEHAVRVLGIVYLQLPSKNNIMWGPLFWKYITPRDGFGFELAVSQDSFKFVARLHVSWSFLGIKTTGDLFITSKGIYANAEATLFNLFRVRLTLGADVSLHPMDWALWVRGQFKAGKDNSFHDSLWDAVSKVVNNVGNIAKSRMNQAERIQTTATKKLSDSQTKVNNAKENLKLKETAVDAAIARLEATKQVLEDAKAPFKAVNSKLVEAQRKLDLLCEIKTCENICVLSSIIKPACKITRWFKYPCPKARCNVKIPRLKCVMDNSVCRAKRTLAYAALAVAQGLVHLPILALDAAKAGVSVAQIMLGKSRGLKDVASSLYDVAMAGAEGVKSLANAASRAVSYLKASLRGALQLFNSLVANTLQNLIDFKECGFEVKLSIKSIFKFEAYCEVNLMKSGWKKYHFMMDFNNIRGSLWSMADSLTGKILKSGIFGKRKKRTVEGEEFVKLHMIDLYKRSIGGEDEVANITYETDDATANTSNYVEFWVKRCMQYEPIMNFLGESLDSLIDVSQQMYLDAEEAEKNASMYFDDLNILPNIPSSIDDAEAELALREFNITRKELEDALKNINIQDDPEAREVSATIEEVRLQQIETMQIFRNYEIVALWKYQMENYTKQTFPDDRCSSFYDCVVWAFGELQYQLDSVDASLVDTAIQYLPKFAEMYYEILDTDSRIAGELPTISTNLKEFWNKFDPRQIFCGTLPEIKTQPNDTLVEINSSITLKCLATSQPNPTYYWYRDGELFLTGENATLVHLRNISIQDEATYSCVAGNHIGNTSSEDAFLDVVYPPSIHSKFPASTKAFFGQTLQCDVSADPKANIEWYSAADPDPVSHNSTLYITAEKRSVTHLYKCIARNAFGIAESTEVVIQAGHARPTCPRFDIQLAFFSIPTNNNNVSLPNVTMSSEDLSVLFQNTLQSMVQLASKDVVVEINTFDFHLGGLNISMYSNCSFTLNCPDDGCEADYENMSKPLKRAVKQLATVVSLEEAILTKNGIAYYFNPAFLEISDEKRICPIDHTATDQYTCGSVTSSGLGLEAPTDIQIIYKDGIRLLTWSPPPYAGQFVKAYNLAIEDKYDGRLFTMNTTSADPWVETPDLQGTHEIRVSALTASYWSQTGVAIIDLHYAEKTADSTTISNLGTIVGVSVTTFVILLALGVISAVMYAQKNHKLGSVSSLSTSLSSSSGASFRTEEGKTQPATPTGWLLGKRGEVVKMTPVPNDKI